jgi:hypothetical protein
MDVADTLRNALGKTVTLRGVPHVLRELLPDRLVLECCGHRVLQGDWTGDAQRRVPQMVEIPLADTRERAHPDLRAVLDQLTAGSGAAQQP